METRYVGDTTRVVGQARSKNKKTNGDSSDNLSIVAAFNRLDNPQHQVDEVCVTLGYKVVELFSEGLYRSPYKPIEELIVNGYDAFAQRVHVITSDLHSPNGFIAVIDDGIGMGVNDLKVLWQIGASIKRTAAYKAQARNRNRPPIGKFGIGKLAPYVLVRHLIHVSKHNGEYYAVDMNFRKVDETEDGTSEDSDANLGGDGNGNGRQVANGGNSGAAVPPASTPALLGPHPDEETQLTTISDTKDISLSLLKLSESEAQTILKSVLDANNNTVQLFGPKAAQTWTVGIMTDLKSIVEVLEEGRLRWIISTGLPITPDFHVFYNNKKVAAARMDGARVWEAYIGKDDAVAQKQGLPIIERTNAPDDMERYGVLLPGLGEVRGKVEVFRDTLVGRGERKADLLQRSHGFFVMVLKRLVNPDDPLFGITPRTHQTFNRFRMEVHCDGLDPWIRSSRESVLQDKTVGQLLTYLKAKFNEAADKYETWLKGQEEQGVIKLPPSLIREPLRTLVRRAASTDGDAHPTHISLSEVLRQKITADEGKWFSDFMSRPPSLSDFVTKARLGLGKPFAVFDADTMKVIVNQDHPIFIHTLALERDTTGLSFWSLAEVLLEAYLLEEGVDLQVTRDVMERRDAFLRRAIGLDRRSAALIAHDLRQAGDQAAGLEIMVTEALRALGFEVTKIGGNGKPDGIALAPLGTRHIHYKVLKGVAEENEEPEKGERYDASYTFTYDAKSTSKDKRKDVNIGRLDTHRRESGAKYVLVVAPDISEGKIWDEAKRFQVTLCSIESLAALLEASVRKPLTFIEFEDMLKSCHTPDETEAWVARFSEDVKTSDTYDIFRILLEGMNSLQVDPIYKDMITSPTLGFVIRGKHSQLDNADKVKEWLQVLIRLVPDLVILDGEFIYLDTTPDTVLKCARQRLNGE
jgi:hypothetical protein